MAQEKTELPTPYRITELRKKGDVPRSRDLNAAVVLVAGLLAALAGGPPVWETFVTAWDQCCRLVGETGRGLPMRAGLAEVGDALRASLPALAAPLAAIASAALVVGYLQVGPLWAAKALTPNLDNLNPGRNLGRAFSKRAIVDVLRALCKLVIAGGVCYGVLKSDLPTLLRLGRADVATTLSLLGHLVWRLAFFLTIVAVAFGVIDAIYQRRAWLKQHSMSKDEIRREYKNQEGSGEIKQARRRAHEEISLAQMYDDVDSGDVLVRNPVHLAVVLRFDADREKAPRLIAKGRGHVARKIVALARKNGLAEQYDIRLARRLYQLPLRATIPTELFDAVSVLLSWAESELAKTGRIPGWRKSPPDR